MYHHPLLLTPGPTPIPERIQRVINEPMIGHRTKAFEAVAEKAYKGLKPVFGSKNDVLIFTSSGTSALEASMVNLLNADDHVAVIVSGAFGNRFKQIAETYFNHVHVFEVAWGEAVNVASFIDFLNDLPANVTAVYTQYCETSTTVVHPIHDLGEALHQHYPETYFVVDGVSCVGAVDVNLERDHIDVLVAGSQKAMMLPPGLAFAAYSDRAGKRFAEVKTPRFYLDFNKYIASAEKNSTPFTPNVSFYKGVAAYAELVEDEGFNNVIERHYIIRDGLRAALKALDLPLLVDDEHASPTVTAFVPPTVEEVSAIKNALLDRFNITIAGGQGKLKGKILRIGHLGMIDTADILQCVSALEVILSELRNESYIGRGTQAYLEVVKEYV
ncbi:putative soluble hydrogenase subunit [Staphylococcus piscifermentans]|uniref:Aminotransferase class V n=1 Tax=Staphylococcus piscifermentans TaxID=70258 RepID=A0A239U2N2_9STAP|nr:alanine--glyoxylate aminotransferase family protein [Staphylococcus piscifermentans]RTX83625.1 alanine--glyoxylate aminotransferase family protein [Staphylococcus piscifermentans]GEP84328.1 aminotransferase class V [Staphylococcus piscifermentans]SNV03223.1 putative soluble hydrogenase subunit [Staphylococcus piscifermentans]